MNLPAWKFTRRHFPEEACWQVPDIQMLVQRFQVFSFQNKDVVGFQWGHIRQTVIDRKNSLSPFLARTRGYLEFITDW